MLNRLNLKKIISGGLLPLMGLGLATVPTTKPVEANQTTPVSAELMLSIDISGSVNSSEYNLQMDGYAAAFRDPDVITAIRVLPDGLAVGLQFWATLPAAPLPWRVLKTEAEILAFADYLDNLSRPNRYTQAVRPWNNQQWGDYRVGSATGIARGLKAATTAILNNQYDGEVLIIDISGDGPENVQRSNNYEALRNARDNAVANEITVNGLPIDPTSSEIIANQYRNYVVGGEDAFAEVSNGFNDFTRAVTTKLEREITNAIPDTVGCPATPDTITLGGIVRDFSESHPDFQYRTGSERDIVTTTLGLDGKPVYGNHPNGTTTTTGKDNFDQWYRTVPGVNQETMYEIELERENLNSATFRYENTSFFPIDGQLGAESRNDSNGNPRNFHFTYEIKTQFTYRGDGTEYLQFSGDDDVWVYINGQRVVDLGGVHMAEDATVTLDTALANQLGLVAGETYPFHFFFAERHTVHSNFILETNMDLWCDSDSDGLPDPEDDRPNSYDTAD